MRVGLQDVCNTFSRRWTKKVKFTKRQQNVVVQRPVEHLLEREIQMSPIRS